MSKKIEEIEGIGPKYGAKLNDAGIKTVEDLLNKGCTPQGRKELCETTGFSNDTILSWTNMADLFRINGVAGEFAELLHAAGVDTVKELKTRNAENLHNKMAEVNNEKKLTRVVPSAERLQDFIDQASKLDPKMTY